MKGCINKIHFLFVEGYTSRLFVFIKRLVKPKYRYTFNRYSIFELLWNRVTPFNKFAKLRFSIYFCSVDVRGKDFSRAEKWFDSTVLNNRASFDPDSSPPSLVINHFSEKDVAMYRCRVDFKYAQTRNAKVNLTIIGM